MDEVPRSCAAIMATLAVVLGGLFFMLTPITRAPNSSAVKQRPTPKQRCETWFLAYAVVWVLCFAVIVASEIYESIGEWGYLGLCSGLAAPLLLQPFVAPSLTGEQDVPLFERHCTKANAWIAIYSYLGNYWGTHYFYCVLGAKYTMPFLPSHQLNKVPICMYFATHFYFSLYHALANKVLRCALGYQASAWRTTFLVALVASMAYIVAFLETLSISAFPYYTFEDRGMVYTTGSAFYAIYLVVSFPMFWRLDSGREPHSLGSACLEASASWMLIMCFLDAVRLSLGYELRMPL